MVVAKGRFNPGGGGLFPHRIVMEGRAIAVAWPLPYGTKAWFGGAGGEPRQEAYDDIAPGLDTIMAACIAAWPRAWPDVQPCAVGRCQDPQAQIRSRWRRVVVTIRPSGDQPE